MRALSEVFNSVAKLFGSSRGSVYASSLLRAGVSIVFIATVLRYVDIYTVWQRFTAIRAIDLALLLSLMAIQTCLFAWRWHLIAHYCGAGLSFPTSVRISVISLFFNQTLPSTLGGDAARILLSRKEGVATEPAVCAVLIDRVIALFALVLLTVVFLPWLARSGIDSRMMEGLAGVAAFLGLGFGLLVTFGEALLAPFGKFAIARKGAALIDFLRGIVFRPKLFSSVLVLSAFIHLISAFVVIAIANAMHIPIQFFAGIALVLPTLLVMTMPISIAGWGVREAAMIVALGYVGVGRADAFAISVAFGLILVIVGIPGGILWLTGIGGESRVRPSVSSKS